MNREKGEMSGMEEGCDQNERSNLQCHLWRDQNNGIKNDSGVCRRTNSSLLNTCWESKYFQYGIVRYHIRFRTKYFLKNINSFLYIIKILILDMQIGTDFGT